ncbi:hypothetical protein CTAYLR_004955 [Chrysophaeum taylorii]|uniref:Choline transporter-like protein n=1 Tax=Chrysophaeum taylorii TaxID=2483200 RepID=A0AAD7XSC8_9STRA|nr:hypothetical protein CTAYLR_004955 [Chrysophaeum taylorii]
MAAEEENLKCNALDAPDDFRGPVGDRRCTDCLWLLVLIAHWVSVVVISFIAFGWVDSTSRLRQGRPKILTHWIDHNGDICKHDKRYLYFPNPLGRSYTSGGQIASDYVSYPVISGPHEGEVAPGLYGVCVHSCPKSGTVTDATTCINGTSCDTWDAYKTEKLVHFCIPDEDGVDLEDDALQATSNKAFNFFQRMFGDVVSAATPVAVSGVVLPFVAGFAYLVLLRVPGVLFLVVWGSIALVLCSLIGLGALSRENYQHLKNSDDDDDDQVDKQNKRASLILSYVFWIASGIFACVICFLRKQTMLAMGIVKEAARALNDMIAVVLLPFVAGALMVVAIILLFVSFIYVATGGKKKQINSDHHGELPMPYHTYHITNSQFYTLWFLLFCSFWTMEFIDATCQLVLATAGATWYFTRDKSSISIQTVGFAMRHAVFYHAGTAALGSLLIAVVRLVRAILAWIQERAEKALDAAGPSLLKRVVKCFFCCIQCCLWCLKKCLRFLNKNAYVCTAIFGYSFCKSARKAFFLIARNIRRIAALEAVGNLIFLLGKLLIAFCCGLVALYWLDAYYREETHSIVFPAVCAIILAYYVGATFVNVLDVIADTILICFIADEELFGRDSDRCFATAGLKIYIKAAAASASSSSQRSNKRLDASANHNAML